MKKTTLTLLIALITFSCFSQSFPKKQTLIPLSNVNGVPFYKEQDMNDWVIDGFEIDNDGTFYFLGGDKVDCLAVFSGTKQIVRKTYKEWPGRQLYFYKNNLYTFGGEKKNQNLIKVLNPSTGLIIKTYCNIPDKHIDQYFFTDSSIIIGAMGDTAMWYERYSLSGKFIGKSPNEYGVPSFIIPENGKFSSCEFLGKWNDNYVFWGNSDLNAPHQLYLVDNKGKILAKRIIPKGLTGKGYFEESDEDRKVRNGSFFVLGRKGNDALITEIPLASFFGK
ncbi:hypothetical protein [Mucilaginibacter gotjawali]|uniref:Uncharacterized protein n=2 Tax=Mucilaginibacter gotjawali TaxID=1550579 RepID=A0A839SKA5_9SPHI|nr:hypothetical protein [Mucilaginibacter gotjawali]MBB3056907.1 hypothetical protein [Mucilaginibacter gotjawali]BAU55987.1 hypothetical protein MgSA37_04179 [Mucilaginibacter gotjawali]